ncbi:unnamed protein product [Musa hybrid cultivar]
MHPHDHHGQTTMSFRQPSRLVLIIETSSLKYYQLNQNGWSELEGYLFTH